jgi:RimJ/RimL family protein N-acetyltransferase
MKFEILYSLHHSDMDVCEIKRLGLPVGSPPSEVYQWLAACRGKIWPLDFKSMERGEVERREFVEGSLRFDKTQGRFTFLGQTFSLEPQAPSETLLQNISEFFCRKPPPGFRELRPSDIHSFQTWLFDAEVIRYSQTKFHHFKAPQDVASWFFETLRDPKVFQWGILDETGSKLIGYAGISALNSVDRNGEFFILIGDKTHWRRGVASRVTPQIVEWGFSQLGLHRVFLTASSNNPGALKAYEKAGFVLEGQMREAFFRAGTFSDKVIMGVLLDDLKNRQRDQF